MPPLHNQNSVGSDVQRSACGNYADKMVIDDETNAGDQRQYKGQGDNSELVSGKTMNTRPYDIYGIYPGILYRGGPPNPKKRNFDMTEDDDDDDPMAAQGHIKGPPPAAESETLGTGSDQKRHQDRDRLHVQQAAPAPLIPEQHHGYGPVVDGYCSQEYMDAWQNNWYDGLDQQNRVDHSPSASMEENRKWLLKFMYGPNGIM